MNTTRLTRAMVVAAGVTCAASLFHPPGAAAGAAGSRSETITMVSIHQKGSPGQISLFKADQNSMGRQELAEGDQGYEALEKQMKTMMQETGATYCELTLPSDAGGAVRVNIVGLGPEARDAVIAATELSLHHPDGTERPPLKRRCSPDVRLER